MSGPAGSNRVGEPRSRKGPDRAHDDVKRDILDAGAVPASEMDDQVRRLRHGADDEVEAAKPRGKPRAAGPGGRPRSED